MKFSIRRKKLQPKHQPVDPELLQAEYESTKAYRDSRCKQSGCWEPAVKDGLCQVHWEHANICPGCGKKLADCHRGECVDESDDDDDSLDGEDVYPIEVYGRV